ncbi:MAG: peptidoglycan DD-metalloendopeptidase family protein [Gaiellaceae bacterium]
MARELERPLDTATAGGREVERDEQHLHRLDGTRAFLVAGLLLLALALPGVAGAYGWPVRPFDAPHPLRGYFDDPREETAARVSFHFGVDISVPDGTPVYSVSRGTVNARGHSLSVSAPDGTEFGYWHVAPSVRDGEHVALHQLLGRVEPGWGHVHFAENRGGVYLNPLRRGGIEPYTDDTAPTIASILILSGRHFASIEGVHGSVDLVADAYDTPPLTPPGSWAQTRVTPALVRWRLLGATGELGAWHTAADFRSILLPDELFPLVWAPGTRQNRADKPGRYRFYLRQALDTTTLADGVYALEVAVSDTAGNRTASALPFRVANA